MATKDVFSEVDRFAGLSDRSIPIQQTRIESPDCKNVEFSERVMQRRNGIQRLHDNMLRDSSIRVEGQNQYLRFPHQAAYIPSNRLFLSIDVVLREQPSAEVTVLQKGYGSTSNLFVRMSYDSGASPNGGWYCRAYNGTSLQSALVADGTALGGPIDLYRHLELYWSGTGDVYTFRVLDVFGTVIGSGSLTLPSFSTTTEDFIVGVGMSGSGILGTDYAHATLAEFRLGDSSSSSPVWAGIVDRELDSGPDSSEYTDLIGYWKLNDGTGSQLSDSAGSNPGFAGREGVEWVSGPSVLGATGLRFFGDQGFVLVDASAWAAGVFNDNSGGALGFNDYRDWTLGILYVPQLVEGETSLRAGTLIWSGNNATVPAPIGITIGDATGIGGTANDVTLHYLNNGGTSDTIAAGIDLTSFIDERIRIIVQFRHFGPMVGPVDQIKLFVYPEHAYATLGYKAVTMTVTGTGNPSTVSNHISLGAKLLTLAPPFSQRDLSIYGIIDDFYVVDRPALAGGAQSFGPGVPGYSNPWLQNSPNGFMELTQSILMSVNVGNQNVEITAYLKLNEGSGNVLYSEGAKTTYASLYPAQGSGIRWDIGIVEPYLPPEIDLIADYKTFDKTGKATVDRYALSGTTLYRLDGTTMVPVAGNIHKGGKATCAQYQDMLIIGRPNGQRPVTWNGSSLSYLGIVAPFAPPVATVSPSGGSIPAGTVYIYQTYRNSVTGEESNPSVEYQCTFSGGSSSITGITIQVSPDPQVNERRIWVTGSNVPGSTAYLLDTISDNVTTSVTTVYTVLPSAPPTLIYLDNEEAPVGSVVEVAKGRVLVSGNPTYPSRVWYSAPYRPGAFNFTDNYSDVDDNQSNPVRGMRFLSDSIAVVMNDRVAYLTETGQDEQPYIRSFAGEGLDGGSGPLTIVAYSNQLFLLGERDIWLVDPSNSLNLSSPVQEGRPAISHLMRSELDPAYRHEYSMTFHRARNQLWLTYRQLVGSPLRNDRILVFQFDQGIWSRYDLSMDIIAEIEDENDDPWIYGGSFGYLCKLDTGDWDGTPGLIAGSVTGGSASSLQDSGQNWTVNALKGLEVYWYDASAGVAREARIRSNTATELKFYSTVEAPAIGDGYVVGGIPWYADFVADFGSPLTVKRIRFLELSGKSDADQNVLRVSITPNAGDRRDGYSSSESVDFFDYWTKGQQFKRLRIGCLGRSFRIRIGDSGVLDVTTEEPVPSLTGRIEIWPWVLRGEQVSAKR